MSAGGLVVVVGSAVLVSVWLAVGVIALVSGLLWLRAAERSRRAPVQPALSLARPTSGETKAEPHEPDALAG
jgi:hypothetical protein